MPGSHEPNGLPSYSTFAPFDSMPESGTAPSHLLPGNFDIFEWHPAYQSCQKYFLDQAQHNSAVQAVAALINISLPCQWNSSPIHTFSSLREGSAAAPNSTFSAGTYTPQPRTTNAVSLIPFIRRLVVTGFDREPVLHGFFGDDWRKGIGPMQECERRNYLFAAKSGGWAKVKQQYDMGPYETVPFLQPPQNIQLAEIQNAERAWSKWLACEDWCLGPRAPDTSSESGPSPG